MEKMNGRWMAEIKHGGIFPDRIKGNEESQSLVAQIEEMLPIVKWMKHNGPDISHKDWPLTALSREIEARFPEGK